MIVDWLKFCKATWSDENFNVLNNLAEPTNGFSITVNVDQGIEKAI